MQAKKPSYEKELSNYHFCLFDNFLFWAKEPGIGNKSLEALYPWRD
jgi:hypothetical protein